jgi:transcriptional regulator with XRE-family HTH domain
MIPFHIHLLPYKTSCKLIYDNKQRWVLTMHSFHHILKELRKSRNLSQEDVAKAIATTVTTISRYESGEREPDLEKLCMLADFFHVSLDYLLGREQKENDIENSEIIHYLNRLEALEHEISAIKSRLKKLLQ